MEFSINFVKDGQNAFISISGLDFVHSHKEEIKEKLNEALSLALGISEPTISQFEIEEKALPEQHLVPNHEKKVQPKIKKEEQITYEKRDGIIKNLEEIEIVGNLGNKTLKAEELSNEINEELLKLRNKEEDNYDYVKDMLERDIIKQVFVYSSSRSNPKLLNELVCHLSAKKLANK